MEVIVIEHEAFKRLEDMFIESQTIIQRQAEIITASKIGLMNARQVAELTGYCEKTIKLRKAEIGYTTLGRDIKFKPSDVEAWLARHYRSPRRKGLAM